MRRRDSGSALLTVLWLSLVLGLVAASLAEVARRTANSTRILEAGRKADFALPNLRERAVFDLIARRAPRGASYAVEKGVTFEPDGIPRVTADGIVQIIPAGGLVDLNSAHPDVLEALALEVPAFDRPAVQFVSLSDAAIPEEIRPLATIYAGLMAPDIRVAPAAVLKLFPGVTGGIIEQLLEQRAPGITPDAYEPPEAWRPTKGEVESKGPVYHIRAWVEGHGREWVVYLPDDDQFAEIWYLLETRKLPFLSDVSEAMPAPRRFQK